MIASLDKFNLINAMTQDQQPDVAPDYRALVCIFLSGGTDGNNMVIPYDGYTVTGGGSTNGYDNVRTVSGLAVPKSALEVAGTASASLLTESVKGKSKADVQGMFDQVHEMVTTGRVKGEVGKLKVFAGVHKFPARVKCAILSWHAVMAALKGDGQPVTTETEEM